MKFFIEKDEEIKDVVAFHLIHRVIEQGLISANGTQYCFVTSFTMSTGRILTVIAEKKNYGYKFLVKRGKSNE